jgi:hypothetical protein
MPVFGLQAQNFLTPGGAAQGFSNLGAALVQAPQEAQRLQWAQQQFQAEQAYRNKSLDQQVTLAQAHQKSLETLMGLRMQTSASNNAATNAARIGASENQKEGRIGASENQEEGRIGAAEITSNGALSRAQTATNVKAALNSGFYKSQDILNHSDALLEAVRENVRKRGVPNIDPTTGQPDLMNTTRAPTSDEIENDPDVVKMRAKNSDTYKTVHDFMQRQNAAQAPAQAPTSAPTPATQAAPVAPAPAQAPAATSFQQAPAPAGRGPVNFTPAQIPMVQAALRANGMNFTPEQTQSYIQQRGHTIGEDSPGQAAPAPVQGDQGAQ